MTKLQTSTINVVDKEIFQIKPQLSLFLAE